MMQRGLGVAKNRETEEEKKSVFRSWQWLSLTGTQKCSGVQMQGGRLECQVKELLWLEGNGETFNVSE